MMENLKEYFLGLSIHKQIKFGIIVSNTFVCILISGIVIINAFIILTLNYHNLVDILDSQEDKSIDNTAVFFDIETFLVIDTSKEVLVWTRNFMENLQNNKDYLNNLNKKVDVEKVVIPFEKLKDNLNCYKFPPTNCIAIKQFDYGERSKEQIDDYNNYIKVLYMTSFMFEEIFRFRTFRDSTSTIFFKLSFLSRRYNLESFYPVTEVLYTPVPDANTLISNNMLYNPTYTKDHFEENIIKYKISVLERYILAKKITYTNFDKDIYNTIISNPNTDFTSLRLQKKPFFYDPSRSLVALIRVINMKFNPNIKPLLTEINIGNATNLSLNQNLDIVEDVIVGDWSGLSLDNYITDLASNFKEIYVIITSFISSIVFSNVNCLWYAKKFEITNNLTSEFNASIFMQIQKRNFTNLALMTANQCIKNPKARKELEEKIMDYYKNDTDPNKNIFDNDVVKLMRVKNSIKLFDAFQNNSGKNITYDFNQTSKKILNYPTKVNKISSMPSEDGNFYKIFRLYWPNIFTQTLINSIFLNNYEINSFLIKGMSFLLVDSRVIFNRVFGGFCMIILYTLIIWIFESIIMLFILNQVTLSLTRPLDTLTVHVRSIGQETIEAKKLGQMENLIYEDDDDINELFSICKHMIKGGLSEDKHFVNKEITTQNLIHCIKANNIIVDEEFVENSGLTSGNHIFSYRGNQLQEKIKMLKDDFTHATYAKRVTKINTRIRKIGLSVFKSNGTLSFKNKDGKAELDQLFTSINWKEKQGHKDHEKRDIFHILFDLEKKHFRAETFKKLEVIDEKNLIKNKDKEINLYEIHKKVLAKHNFKDLKIVKF